MSGGALFGNAGSRSQSKNLLEFRAGKMTLRGRMVHPDKRKGLVYIYQAEDTLMHFCWKDRQKGTIEDDLIIFPDDVEYKPVPQCTTGRVYVLKFKSNQRKMFFWLQEPKTDKDEDICRKLNDFLNNPPAPGSSHGGGSSLASLPAELAGLGAVLQRQDNAKRIKLSSLSDTTLQDLPIEMLERILVQAVVLEVKDLKMAKSVWKGKAGPVIVRLATVCSHWSSILTTDYFRNEVNRVLDETAQETVRMEILHQHPLPCQISKVTTNKEEIFLLCRHAQGDRDRVINVYDRNNMAAVKDVIVLPRSNAMGMAACMVSNCLYILYFDLPVGVSVFRITKGEDNKFIISPWIQDTNMVCADLTASVNGSLIIASNLHWLRPAVVSIYDANGVLECRLRFYLELNKEHHYVDSVIQRSNGNIVVVSPNREDNRKFTEMEKSGKIVHRHQSSLSGMFVSSLADNFGRLFIRASPDTVGLFDSEFNVLDVAGPPLTDRQFFDQRILHYCTSSNQIISVVHDPNCVNGILTGFRLT